MATYRSIASTETDPQAPVTSALMKALEANPTAIAEGASGAPRVQCAAFPGIVGLARFDHSNTTPVVVALPYVSTWVRGDLYVGTSGGINLFRMRASSDAGATWGAYSNLFSLTATAGSINGQMYLDRVTGDFDFRYAGAGYTAGRGTGTLAVSAGMNALEFSFSSALGSPLGRQFVNYLGEAN